MESKRKFKKRILPEEDKQRKHRTPTTTKPIITTNTKQENTKKEVKITENLKIIYTNADQLTSHKIQETIDQSRTTSPCCYLRG